MRIVSLLPSATEMICAIGLADQLCGVSHECDYPPAVTSLPRVTKSIVHPDASSAEIDRLVSEKSRDEISLYSLDQRLLRELKPDVIVTQSLCAVCALAPSEVQLALESLSLTPRVINLSPTTLGDVLNEILMLGRTLGHESAAVSAVDSLSARIDDVKRRGEAMTDRPGVVLLEWLDPLFTAGHWNPELVRVAGGKELFGQEGGKSRRIEWSDLQTVDPECIVVACCGFDVNRSLQDVELLATRPGFAALRAVREGKLYVADGSAYFNRSGPRLVDSLELLAHAIDPRVHPLPRGLDLLCFSRPGE